MYFTHLEKSLVYLLWDILLLLYRSKKMYFSDLYDTLTFHTFLYTEEIRFIFVFINLIFCFHSFFISYTGMNIQKIILEFVFELSKTMMIKDVNIQI